MTDRDPNLERRLIWSPEYGLPIVYPPSQCQTCKHRHFHDDTRIACDAFRTQIPTPILIGEFDHRNAYPGDNGVRYEPLDESADEG